MSPYRDDPDRDLVEWCEGAPLVHINVADEVAEIASWVWLALAAVIICAAMGVI